MTDIPYQDGGALLADSPVYIERDADTRARRHLRRMEYITLVEPRQQGKTSLINRMAGQFQPQDYVFAYADLTTLDKTSEAAWYHSLCDWLLRQIPYIPRASLPSLPTNGNTWRNFLADLAEEAETARYNLVLALDEVGSTPETRATDFFSAIRSVYNSRQSIPSFRHLTFIVAGAYNPKELIKDRTISNFNVDHRIPLADFSLDQIGQLVAHLSLGDRAPLVASRLHYWTGGQPYVSQRLCLYLTEQNDPITADTADSAVERFFHEDTNHLSRIQLHLEDEPELLDYARQITIERTRFSPSVNDLHFRLSHIIGIISADEGGHCRIRNRIYERAFPHLSQATIHKAVSAQSLVPFKLQLTWQDDLDLRVRALETPMGEPHALSRLPYTVDELAAVLKALRAHEYDDTRFTSEQRDALRRLGLLLGSHFAPDLTKRIGEQLFKALMTQDVNTAFRMAHNQARKVGGVVALQLRFDENAVDLARYPWELLHDGRRHLLPSQAAGLTRYISYPEVPARLTVHPPLRLLYLAPRPTDLVPLPMGEERERIRQALRGLEQEGMLHIANPSTQTYDALLDYLEDHTVHIIHFDGHGAFARRCQRCEDLNYPRLAQCASCGANLELVTPQGYLAFEEGNPAQDVHWVSSTTLGHLLYGPSLRLVVLSACSSATVRGETLFGGVAPSLIQAGVPAVVATQLPISVSAATAFTRGFYRALARFESVPAAVNAGRRRLFEEREWFIPVLYMRSQDDDGRLFTPS